MSEIYIRDKFISKLSDYGFMCLLGICLHANCKNIPEGKPGGITQKLVAMELTDNITKSLTRAIASGFKDLEENNLISVIDKYHYRVDYSKLCYDNDFYTKIYDYEIFKIMNYESHDKKSGLLKYMAALFSTFNKKKKIGYMPQTYIMEGISKSASTIGKYNKILTDLGIVGIIKIPPHYLENGKLSRSNNIYYRPEDKDKAIGFANRLINTKEDI